MVQGGDVDIHRLRAALLNHIWVFGCFHIYLFNFFPFDLVFFRLEPYRKVLENIVFSIVFGVSPRSRRRVLTKTPRAMAKTF